MQYYLVIGPTGSGKTGRSVRLAQQLNAPVVSLDRIQAFDDLATGSGRPTSDELERTTRLYLDHRRLADGELLVTTALGTLYRLLAELSKKHTKIIIEGGSISLSSVLLGDPVFTTQLHQVIVRTVQREDAYRERIFQRVQEMIVGRTPSMFDEMTMAWDDTRSRAVIAPIVGYAQSLAWCASYGVAPQTLAERCRQSCKVATTLANVVTDSHIAYASQQRAVFSEILLPFRNLVSTDLVC